MESSNRSEFVEDEKAGDLEENGPSGRVSSAFTFAINSDWHQKQGKNSDGLVDELSTKTDETDDEKFDPQFEPLVYLPLVETKTLEEEETVLWSERAKLFRFVQLRDGPPEWKERGTGVLKILFHTTRKCTRLVMRRDHTLKVCANHYILPQMTLRSHAQSDRTWLWSTPADVSDEVAHPEVLAARFRTASIAAEFREHFNEAKSIMLEYQSKAEERAKEESKDRSSLTGSCVDHSVSDSSDKAAEEISGKLKSVSLDTQNA